jgi:RNA polymerase sigma factor (sigma-70 family)
MRSATPLDATDPPCSAEWETFYRDNIVSLYRVVYSKVGNRPDAEDLTSEVFARALPHLRCGASGGEAHRYLFAAARTVLADHWSRRLGVAITALADNSIQPSTPTETPTATNLGRVQEVLRQLPDQYRSILELRFLSGCSIKESAARMGISANNARVLQHRALRRAAQLGLGAINEPGSDVDDWS